MNASQEPDKTMWDPGWRKSMPDQEIKKKEKFSTSLLGASSDAEFLRANICTHTMR